MSPEQKGAYKDDLRLVDSTIHSQSSIEGTPYENGQEIAATPINVTFEDESQPYFEEPVDTMPQHADHRHLPEEQEPFDREGFKQDLSPRELEVWALKEKGYKDKEIAERLIIEVGTVKLHAHSARRKQKAYYEQAAVPLPDSLAGIPKLKETLASSPDLTKLHPSEKRILDLIEEGMDVDAVALAVGRDAGYVQKVVTAMTSVLSGELTDAEKVVEGYLAQGKTNNEIAQLLVIAEGTVKNHVNKIMRKRGINSRKDLITSQHQEPVYVNVELERGIHPDEGVLLPHERELTDREMEIARLITDSSYTNQQLADCFGIEVGTVKNHVHSIMSKLGARRRDEILPLLNRQSASPSTTGNIYTYSAHGRDIPVSTTIEKQVPANPTQVLTPTQLKVFMSLDKGNNPVDAPLRTRENEEIALLLGMEVGTAKNHIHQVLKKLGVSNRNDAFMLLQHYRQQGIL